MNTRNILVWLTIIMSLLPVGCASLKGTSKLNDNNNLDAVAAHLLIITTQSDIITMQSELITKYEKQFNEEYEKKIEESKEKIETIKTLKSINKKWGDINEESLELFEQKLDDDAKRKLDESMKEKIKLAMISEKLDKGISAWVYLSVSYGYLLYGRYEEADKTLAELVRVAVDIKDPLNFILLTDLLYSRFMFLKTVDDIPDIDKEKIVEIMNKTYQNLWLGWLSRQFNIEKDELKEQEMPTK